MKLKPYPKYKDSGIQWIGKIPEGWEVNKLKYNYEIIGKTDIPASEGNEEGNFPFFTSGESIKYIDNPVINGEYIIVGDGGIPNFKYYKGYFSYSDHCFLLKTNKKTSTKFLYYFLIGNIETLDILCFHGMGLRNLDKYKFNSFFSNLPPPPDQTAITNFLDRQTAKIDALIGKDKKLIALLKEKRTALINHAVTKGLPVRATQTGLDPNIILKDSGIEWIGEIPERWEVRKLKFALSSKRNSIKTGPFGSQLTIDEMYNHEYKVYNQKNVINKDEGIGENYISADKFKELITFKVEPGDLLISTRGTIGKTLKLSNKANVGVLHPCLMKINNNDKIIDNRFIEILIEESDIVLNQLKLLSNATTIDVIYQDNLKEIQLILPPLFKQKQIVKYIDKATSKIDKTIKLIEQKINLLEEYKKSLIHYVVTGKVDVREVET